MKNQVALNFGFFMTVYLMPLAVPSGRGIQRGEPTGVASFEWVPPFDKSSEPARADRLLDWAASPSWPLAIYLMSLKTFKGMTPPPGFGL